MHKQTQAMTTGPDVPMEDNPAYGEVSIYDTVREPKEN